MTQQLSTLQIATFGSEGQEGIALGIRSFPVQKLAFICFDTDKNKSEEFARKIKNVLGLPITINLVTKENVIRDTMERVNEIMNLEGRNFQQVLMNVSSGDKLIGCAHYLVQHTLLHLIQYMKQVVAVVVLLCPVPLAVVEYIVSDRILVGRHYKDIVQSLRHSRIYQNNSSLLDLLLYHSMAIVAVRVLLVEGDNLFLLLDILVVLEEMVVVVLLLLLWLLRC
jgi:hypothetical protein